VRWSYLTALMASMDTPEEVRSWRGSRDRGLLLRNSVGVAPRCARDEVLEANGFDCQVGGKAVRFNKSNFRKAEAEIMRTFRRPIRHAPDPIRATQTDA
jgi:hypothetical protein